MRRYLISVLVLAPGMMAGIAALNWVVDPFGLWGAGRLTGFRLNRPELLVSHAHIVQIHRAFSLPLHTAIIGTSRAGVGLDPGHPALGPARSYNLSLPGMQAEESSLLVKHLVAETTVKRIIWGLDFFTFNCAQPVPRRFDMERFAPPDRYRLLVAQESLEAVLRTLLQPRDSPPLVQFAEDGRTLLDLGILVNANGHRAMFQDIETRLLRRVYVPPFSLDCPGKRRVLPWEYFRAALRATHDHGAEVQMLISPSHARMWETVRASGRWPLWEEWKRELVRINEEEAVRAGRRPFALWDFSGYNSLTTELLPAPGEMKTEMQWHWESSHYKKELGDLVLDRMFHFHRGGRMAADDFGELLNENNIEAHLLRIRNDRETWASRSPEDVREVEAAVSKVRRQMSNSLLTAQ